MDEFDFTNPTLRRTYMPQPPHALELMNALGHQNPAETPLDMLPSSSPNMSLYSRGQPSSLYDTHASDLSGTTGLDSASAAADYALIEDVIRQRSEIRQAQAARLHNGPFEPRVSQAAMRSLEMEEARMAGLTGGSDLNTGLSSLTRQIPGYSGGMGGFGQRGRGLGLPGLYDNGMGLMDLSSQRMQDEELLRGLRESNMPLASLMNQERGSDFRGNHHHGIMNTPPHSRLSCRSCGRWNFANHIELLEHESICAASMENAALMPRQRMPNPESFNMDQSISQALAHDRASHTSISTVEEIVNKLTSGSSHMPLESSTSVSNESKSILLAMPTDKDWITPLHCFVRLYCVELFTATTSDIVHRSSKGKRGAIHAERIGIRCPHCHKGHSSAHTSKCGLNKGSVYFPTSIASLYNAVMNLLQRHMHVCENVPKEILQRYNDLKADDARSGTSKKYWIESAKTLGLVDTEHGIQFSSHASPSFPNFHQPTECFSTDGVGTPTPSPISNLNMYPKGAGSPSLSNGDDTLFSDIEGGPLVAPEYKYLATAYSYALLSQMQACVFTEADRLGKRKGLPLDFAGLACRHCYGGYGSGRFFPSNIKTMSDTSKTLNVLHSHMMRCRKCPTRVKVGLQTLRLGHDEERSKMKFGSQKAFFVNIWKRLHGDRPFDGQKLLMKPKESMVEAIEDADRKSPVSVEEVASVSGASVSEISVPDSPSSLIEELVGI